MGAVSDALRSSAEEFGAEVRTNAPVERILRKDGRVTGVVLEGGEELEADVVVAATHPRITFLEQLGRKSYLMNLLATSSGGTPAAGSSNQPRPLGATRLQCRSRSGGAPRRGHRAAHSIDYIEEAFQDARRGNRRAGRSPTASYPRCSTARSAPRGTT